MHTMEPMLKNKRIKKRPVQTVSIFIVDDDISYLYPLVFYLQKNTHYKIHCFTNGEDCVKNINLKPSLVILDFNLNPQAPNTLDGLDVLRRIRNVSPKTKVVILSSRDAYQGVIDSLRLGAYTYVLKDTEAIASIKNIIHSIGNNRGKEPKIGLV
jgi:DNA-binding NarL/FixJ family response regulator